MKKFLFLFGALCAAFCSADAFARALCPDSMTQKQCCTKDGAYDYADAKTICGLGNIQDSDGYYADCYICGSSLIQPSTGCGVGCAKCTGSYCKLCESGFYMKSGKCYPCEFISVTNGTCLACSSTGTCTEVSCKDGYKANGAKCEEDAETVCGKGSHYVNGSADVNCECDVGYYSSTGYAKSGDNCLPCPVGTYANNAGSTSCKPCPEGRYADDTGNMVCKMCPAGTYADTKGNTSCRACTNGKCEHEGMENKCNGGSVWTNGIGCLCSSGYYSLTGTGRDCSPCSAISVPNGTCTACSPTGTCTEVLCDDGYEADGTTCQLSCPAGQYLKGSVCVNCSTIPNGVCQSCTSDNSCDDVKCDDGYTLSADGKTCVSACPENCKTCVKGVCTECGDGYTLVDGQCNISCDRYNVGKGTCVECDENRCTDAECEGKNAFFNPIFSKCGVECEDNQYLDSSYTCQDCPAGQTSSGGWFSNPTNCYSCESIPVDGGTCTECKNGFCTEARCQDGYVPDSSKTACIAARAACESPLTISDDGCCCVK